MRSHRPVVRWRQPRSIHLGDEHGCVQLVDAGGETTRRREPRGVSGTLEVSPTGSIPHRENPARQVANDKVEASRAKLHLGQEAPKGIRPLTRVAVQQHKDKQRQEPDPPQPKFTGREGAAKGGSMGSTVTVFRQTTSGERLVSRGFGSIRPGAHFAHIEPD